VRYLILSDLHANLEALQAVLKDAEGEYDRIACCGDLVGYCADPNAVAEWARENCASVVRGNHDKASAGMEDLEWFNPVARTAALWTRQQLTPENFEYVRTLARGPMPVDGFEILHGFPVDEDAYLVNGAEAEEAFGYVQTRVSFFGHSHLQGGFILNRTRVETIGRPPAGRDRMLLDIDPDCAYLVNPGSVGQPRDADPRAAYVIYDPQDGYLFYRRAAYDVEQAQAKIRAAGLPPLLADRLAAGR
jgi:predicted phosphodiesterase